MSLLIDNVEAMKYCLGYVADYPEDGEFRTRRAFDKFGQPHWIAWDDKEDSCPRFCSESPYPFTPGLEPYSTE